MGCGASAAQPQGGDVPLVASAKAKDQAAQDARAGEGSSKPTAEEGETPDSTSARSAARTADAEQPPQPAADAELEAVYMLENLNAPGMYLRIPGDPEVEDGALAEISGEIESAWCKLKLLLQADTANTYLLESALVAGKYLGVQEAKDEDGGLVEVCGDASAPSAHWQLWPILAEEVDGNEETFLLENVNAAGKFLQVVQGGTSAGCHLEISSCSSATSAHWRIPKLVVPSVERVTTDPVRRMSMCAQPTNSVRMEEGEMDELVAAQEEVERAERAEADAALYKLEKAEAPGMYLHLVSGGADDGTSAEIYDDPEAGTIPWRIRLLEGSADVFVIENAKVGKYLHVAYGGSSNGDNVDIDSEIAPSSQWRIQPVEGMEECFNIENVNAEGMYLHVSNGGSSNGDNVEIYSDITASSAKWRIAGFKLPQS